MRTLSDFKYTLGGFVTGAVGSVATAFSLREYLFEKFGVNNYIQEKLSSGNIKIDLVCWPFCDPLYTYIPAAIAMGIIVSGTLAGMTIGAYLDSRRMGRDSNDNSANQKA